MEPVTFLLPGVYAVFLWWFTTGLIMATYGRPPWVTRLCFIGASLMLVASLIGIIATRGGTRSLDVYLAITFGVCVWGWQVASYYLGFVTGPTFTTRRRKWNENLVERFKMVLHFSIYHEVLAIGTAFVLAVLLWDAPNRWGLWIYLALLLMHASAQLNVFLGVRNFRIEYLPKHLHHLDRFLGRKPNNALLPFSVIIASSVAVALLYQGIAPTTNPAHSVGFLFIATMISLGVVEHCLMVLPIPSMIWGWGLRPVPEPTKSKGQM